MYHNEIYIGGIDLGSINGMPVGIYRRDGLNGGVPTYVSIPADGISGEKSYGGMYGSWLRDCFAIISDTALMLFIKRLRQK